ncbi:hypothetical protein E4U51_005261 [Claviceps purpurea]|nr:hypothetical protein E4U51_005261 [Claviceps purpurea]KAG6256892.1 hypothetical protein E4U49_006851 [Claviceps purpurea]
MDSPRERPSGIPRLSRLPVPRSSIPRPATATSTNPSLRAKPSRDNFGGGELNPPKSRTAVSRDHLRPSTSGSTSLGSHEAPVETISSRYQLRPSEQRPPTAKARLQSSQSTPKKERDVSNYHERPLAHVTRPEVDLAARLEPYADDASQFSHTQARRAKSPESWPLGSLEARDLENTGAEGHHGIAAGSQSPSTRNQLSLLERTMDTLAQMPSSPAFNRKSSHFFDQSRSVSRAESGSSRPGSSHNPDGPGRSLSRQGSRSGSSGVQDPPTTPNFRASTMSFKDGISSINGTPRGTSAIDQVKTPQTKTVPTNRLSLTPAAKLAASDLLPVPDIAGSSSPGTEHIRRASVKNGSKTVSGKPAKPRVSGQGLFKKPSLPAMKSLAGSTDGAHATEAGWDGCIPRASSLAAISADQSPALKNRKSSAALREQIAQAKAAKRAAIKQVLVTQEVTAEDRQTVRLDESNSIVEHQDPFNLRKGEDPGSKVLQQRIATARTSGRLNIAALGLKAIPPEVMNMYSLESVGGQGGSWAESVDLTRLVGADNEIGQLGDEIFPDRSLDSFNDDNGDDGQGNIFGGLETLDLHGNVLSAVPLGFRRLVNLTSLNLSSNKLGNESLATILQMTSLRDLKLSKNLLSGPLDAALLDLGALEMLDLHGNNITALPPHMERMSRLRILNMNENQLEMIPFDSLCKLPLTELHVRKNRLTGVLIPKPVEGLAYLQTLDASANRLTHLVPEDGQVNLPAVHSVSLSANRIQHFPDIASWTSLLTLSLDENHIARIPENFTSLQKLRYADFSSNDISVIPPEIARMQGLTMIRLTGNPLRDRKLITATTDDLKEILAVRLEPPPSYQEPIGQSTVSPSRRRNGSHVDSKLQAAAEIYPMSLHNDGSGSDAEEEDDDFATPPTSAPHTPTRPRSDTVIKDVWFVKPGGLMDLSKSEMSSLDHQTCSAVAAQNQVRQIQLHHNPLAKIPIPLTAFGLTLSILSLSHSHLAGESYLSEPLELPALRELSIMSNQVTSLSPLTRFLKAPILEKLDASLNRLTALPLDLKRAFPQLSVLLAFSNQLTQLEPDSIRGLRIVDVSSNDIGQLNPRLGLLEGVDGLQRLDVTGNRFKVPRWSILEQGTGAILRWLRGRLPVEEMAAWRAANGGEIGDGLE